MGSRAFARIPLAIQIMALAALYALFGKTATLLAIPPGFATAVWPPSGLALAALVAGGSRLWPGVLLGSLLANSGPLLEGGADRLALAVAITGIATGATLQALLGAWLVRPRFGTLELVRQSEILRFLLLGGPIACMVNPTLATVGLALAGLLPAAEMPFHWWTWWVGDTVGVLIVAPFTLVWIEPGALWRRRRLTVALPLGLMFLLATSLFVRVQMLDEERARALFDRHASAIVEAIEHDLSDVEEVLFSVASLRAAVPELRADTFRAFVSRSLAHHQAIKRLSWAPIVSAVDRAAFEMRARAEGPADFHIVEPTPAGAVIAAGDRPEYVPKRYVEPVQGSEGVLGFDEASEPLRREALARARSTGRAAATRAFSVVEAGNRRRLMLVYLALERPQAGHALEGFASATVRIDDLMTAAVRKARHELIAIRLIDATPGAADGLLWASVPAADAKLARLIWLGTIDEGGRRWQVECTALPGFATQTRTWQPWAVLAGGLLFTGMLGAFLLVATGRSVVIDRLSAQRAAELATANQALQQEIAERRTAEESLRAVEEQLRQAQKMEAIGRLAGGVAHDFNNLMTAVIGYGNLLRESLPEGDPRRDDVEQILRAGRHATDLTHQLLAFSRKQVLKPEALDLNRLVAEMDRMLRRLIGETIELRTDLGTAVDPVLVDPGQIHQVVMNLVLNARDAMPAGGQLVVQTRNVEVAEAQVPDLPPGGYVRLTVADTGVGMEDQVMAHIFEPFFTTKSPTKGTGLGLSTVYGIVRQSGGQVTVASSPGRSTTFTVYLPRSNLPVQTPQEPPKSAPTLGTETVLLVEDEPSVRLLVGKILTTQGYRVLFANDGVHALAVSEGYPEPIDLLFTDVVMPHMGGRELAVALLATRPDMRVLFMSGYAESAIEHQGELIPGAAFLSKPFTPDALAAKVRAVLRVEKGAPPTST